VTRIDALREFGQDAIDELDRILGLCEEATEVVSRGRAAFDEDRLLRRAADAIIMHIGEGVSRRKLDAFKLRHEFLGDPSGWQLVKDTANFYDHHYSEVDHEQTWRVLTVDLPTLETFIRSIVSD